MNSTPNSECVSPRLLFNVFLSLSLPLFLFRVLFDSSRFFERPVILFAQGRWTDRDGSARVDSLDHVLLRQYIQNSKFGGRALEIDTSIRGIIVLRETQLVVKNNLILLEREIN